MYYAIVNNNGLFFAGIEEGDTFKDQPVDKWEDHESENVMLYSRKYVAEEMAKNFNGVEVVDYMAYLPLK